MKTSEAYKKVIFSLRADDTISSEEWLEIMRVLLSQLELAEYAESKEREP